MPMIWPALRRKSLRTAAVSVLLGVASLCSTAQTKSGTVDFNRQIQPVLATRCSMCHSQEKRSGGLSLATYSDALDGGRSGAIIHPGSSAKSLVMQRITGEMEPRMPFGGKPLSDTEIATIRTWIDEGARPAPDAPPAKPKWEASLELSAPPVPKSPWPSWSSPVDSFTAVYLANHDAVIRRWLPMPSSPAELISISGDCCRRRKICNGSLPISRRKSANT